MPKNRQSSGIWVGPQARHDLLGLLVGDFGIDGIGAEFGILSPPDRSVRREAHRIKDSRSAPTSVHGL